MMSLRRMFSDLSNESSSAVLDETATVSRPCTSQYSCLKRKAGASFI